MVEQLEEVSPRVTDRAGVPVHQVQVLECHLPDGRVQAGKQRGVRQVALGRHDADDAGLRDAPEIKLKLSMMLVLSTN